MADVRLAWAQMGVQEGKNAKPGWQCLIEPAHTSATTATAFNNQARRHVWTISPTRRKAMAWLFGLN